MDAVLLLAAEWWWVAPAGAGAGALGWYGVRHRGPAGRRLELDAAVHDARRAQAALTRARAQRKVARAELLQAQAEQAAATAPAGAVPEARRRLQLAERLEKAAAAALRARRAAVHAARATMPTGRVRGDALPLARLRAEHDALTSRWIAYETDAAKAIDVPAMSDASSPLLQAFLRAQQEALLLRPATADARMTPAEFAAYREAVRRASLAFDAAERAALRTSGSAAPSDRVADWSALAQDLLGTAQGALARSAEAWQRTERDRRRRRA